MCAHPAPVYVLFLIPYSATRLLSLCGFEVPLQVMVFAFVCWFMLGEVHFGHGHFAYLTFLWLGVANVLVLYNTFRALGPAFDSESSQSSWNQDIENTSPSESTSRLVPPSSVYPGRSINVSSYYERQWENQPTSSLPLNSGTSSVGHHRNNSAASSNSSVSYPYIVSLPTPPRPSQPASMPRQTSSNSRLSPANVPTLVRTFPGQTMPPIAESSRQTEEPRTDEAFSDSELEEIHGWLRNKGALQHMRSPSSSSNVSSSPANSANPRLRQLTLGRERIGTGKKPFTSPQDGNYF